jgi:signal transduction histidine kinase
VPIVVQVGVVAALFVVALVVLWMTGASVVARERRRAQAEELLEKAGNRLAERGRAAIAGAGEFLFFTEDTSRTELDTTLRRNAEEALSGYRDLEGGYLVLNAGSFLGTFPSPPAPAPDLAGSAETNPGAPCRRRGESSLPPLEGGVIEILVDAAIRKRQVSFSIEELEGVRPVTVAIRTAPVMVDGRPAGATWVMTRLVDPLFVDHSLQGYQLAAALALGGLALAFALTVGLARIVRRQAVERDRLQNELRRSERLAALGKLLAGVAHEVRNPLAGIRSTAQLWQRGVVGLDDESLGGLVHEVDRLEEIVSRLLQFSRADAQDLVPGDLNGVISEAARLAAGHAQEKDLRIETDLDLGLPAAAMAAPALLQVFRNLTTNAVQAMPPGGTLRLSTRRDSSRRTISASVIDSGPGLAPDTLNHLFEPFYTTKAEGTGLGLAIAREIALAHRGDLMAANRTDGTGAVFTLVLPVATNESNGVGHP